MAVTFLSFRPPSNYWWGFDLLRFYPAPFRLAWAALALGGLGAAWWIGRGVRMPAVRWPAWIVAIGAALLSAVAFHLFRDRAGLSGHGTEIIVALRQGRPPAPGSFLYNHLEPALTRFLRGVRSTPTLDEAGRLSIVIGAAAIGLVVWLLLRTKKPVTAFGAAAGVLLLFQGSIQLFFGQVEAWVLPSAATLLFFVTARSALEGEALWPAALSAALAMASHPLGWMLAPAFLAVVVIRYRRAPVRFRAGPDVLAFIMVVAGLAAALANRPVPAEWTALRPGAGDLLNTLGLLAAPALIALATLGLSGGGRRAFGSPVLLPVGIAFVLFAAARLFLTTPPGAARDWDFFSLAPMALTALAAEAIGAETSRDAGRSAPGPVQMVVVCLFFLVPWIGIQADPERSTARHLAILEARPALPPRTAATYHAAMGDRFVYLGRTQFAAAAYESAYVASPDPRYSWRAGLCYLNAGQLEKAARAFNETTRRNPLDWQAWSELGNVLCGLNQLTRSETVLRQAILLNATAPEPRIHLARTLAQEGRNREARAMLESARPLLRPGDPATGQFKLLDSSLSRLRIIG